MLYAVLNEQEFSEWIQAKLSNKTFLRLGHKVTLWPLERIALSTCNSCEKLYYFTLADYDKAVNRSCMICNKLFYDFVYCYVSSEMISQSCAGCLIDQGNYDDLFAYIDLQM